MKLLIQKLFLRFVRGRFWNRLLFPLLALIHFPWKKTIVKPYHIQRLRNGDMFFGNSPSMFSYLTWGDYTHVGIYDSKEDVIHEMTPLGMEHTTVDDFMSRNCEVALARCPQFNPQYVESILERVRSKKDAAYDKEFSFKEDSFYCSELIYLCDWQRRIKCSTQDLLGLGWPYISPQGLLNAANVVVLREYKYRRPKA